MATTSEARHALGDNAARLGVEGTVRASLALYNTREEVDCLISALGQIAASRGRGRPGR